ncbi:hypothetical protein AAG570_000483 [Ranatra chinensis]|uniref:Uncharacterized protein n=1 Tax=Ranatra chinensis TaxID=642074 RepID=A0ABD0YX66_9HEMI
MTSVVSTRHHHPAPQRVAEGPHDTTAVCRTAGELLRRVEERVADATYRPAPPTPTEENVDVVPEVPRHKKKSGRRDGSKKRKRSTSCSTASSSCSTSSKRHKKKKKKHGRSVDPPNPRVNPIFLWVRQDDTKIVEVLCEDYDKRNRITLTKTAAGWRAIPRTERLSRQSSYCRSVGSDGFADTKDSEDERAPSCEPAEDRNDDEARDNNDNCEGTEDEEEQEVEDIGEREEAEPEPLLEEGRCPPSPLPTGLVPETTDEEEEKRGDKELDELMNKVISATLPEACADPVDNIDFEEVAASEGAPQFDDPAAERLEPVVAEPESEDFQHPEEPMESDIREPEKCCEMNNGSGNVDENHNNEYEEVDERLPVEDACLLSKIKECSDSDTVDQLYREVDECVEKGLKDLIDELDEHCMRKDGLDDDKHCDNDAGCLDEAMGCVDKSDFKCLESESDYLGHNDCVDLMDELEEMCHGMITQRLKSEEEGKKVEDIDDVYTFVPTPENICKVDEGCYSEHDDKDVNAAELANVTEKMIVDENACGLQYEDANSPINLVLEDKKLFVNTAIKYEKAAKICDPLDPNLDILWRLPEGTTIHQASKPFARNSRSEEDVLPAHQHNKTTGKFADILNIPQPRLSNGVQEEPLNLGKAKIEKCPPQLKEIKPSITLDKKPPPKLEDINLKKILNNQQTKCKADSDITMDAKTKSKLLELLTSETLEDKLDPLAQLKEVLSDPNLTVPDPLLVPRARLSALVANPAKEIPRLLTLKQEKLTYPKLDPDLLVVSLAHLQSILQNSGKDDELARMYHQQAQMLQSQLKQQEHGYIDQATANALNQMLWLPYLNQLEAAAAACGNNKEFLNMLNMVFPSYPYVQSPYLQQIPQQGYEYNASLQNQMLSAWQDAVQKPQQEGTNQKTDSSKKYDSYKMYLKPEKKSTSRTSPVPNKYQHYKQRNNNNNYMFGNMNGAYNYGDRGATAGRHTGGQLQYGQQQHRQSAAAAAAATGRPNETSSQYAKQARGASHNMYHQQHQNPYLHHRQRASGERPAADGRRQAHSQLPKDYVFLQAQAEVKPSAAPSFGKFCAESAKPAPDQEPGARRGGEAASAESAKPKLKVKAHLVDPNARPKLLKFDDDGLVGGPPGGPPGHSAAAVAAAAAAAAAAAQHFHDPAHTHLWHPLFSRDEVVLETPRPEVPKDVYRRTGDTENSNGTRHTIGCIKDG